MQIKDSLSKTGFWDRLFILASVAGAAAALIVAFVSPNSTGELPVGTAAMVDGRPIPLERLRKQVFATGSESSKPLGDAQRQAILKRLIDEELLLSRAMDLSLHLQDQSVRSRLVRSMIRKVEASGNSKKATTQQLKDFYALEKQRFVRPARLHAEHLVFAAKSGSAKDLSDALSRATAADAALTRKESAAGVRKQYADAEPSLVPQGLLPVKSLTQYMPAILVETALKVPAKQHTRPMRLQNGFHIVLVHAIQLDAAPAFEKIREQIRFEYQKQRADGRLRDYLENLRTLYSVEVARDLR